VIDPNKRISDQIDARFTAPVSVIKKAGLVGAQMNNVDLSGYNLEGTNFTNASLRAVDFSRANLRNCIFIGADLSRSCLYQADCTGADFSAADLTMSYARGTLFENCTFLWAQLRRVTYKNCFFINCNLEKADFAGGFFVGSVFNGSNTRGVRNVDGKHGAIFDWYLRPGGGSPQYEPTPGYIRMMTSSTGTVSFQENAARRSAHASSD
jgi:hypothetical protein